MPDERTYCCSSLTLRPFYLPTKVFTIRWPFGLVLARYRCSFLKH